MAREAKIGIVLIGVLLTVFGGLLVKRLSRPANLPVASMAESPTNRAAETPVAGSLLPVRSPQSLAPTLVTPKIESNKPLNLAARSAHGSDASSSERSTWAEPSNDLRSGGSSLDSAPVDSQSLLAAPMPIAELGGRYGAADQTAQPIDPEQPTDTAEAYPKEQSYRSAYAATDDTAQNDVPDSKATTRSAEPIAVADPFQRVRRQEPATYDAQTAAGTAPAPNSADRYRATLQPPVPTTPWPAGPIPDKGYAGAKNPQQFSTPPAAAMPVAASPIASHGPMRAVGIQRDGDQYTIQPGDSLWAISEKAYGTGAFFKALNEHNRKRYKGGDALKVGQTLTVPDEAVLRRAYPDLCPKPYKAVASVQQRLVSASTRLRGAGRVYVVEEGDTLFEIARHELGKPSRWGEIYDLNRDVLGDDFDYMRPGTELILPGESRGANTATRQSDGRYPR